MNELSQAADRAVSDNNAVAFHETKYNGNRANAARNFLNDYFKVSQNCGVNLVSCFAASYTNLNGDDISVSNDPHAVVALASGASIAINQTYMRHYSEEHGYYSIIVDVNGAKEPNIAGRDLFNMELYTDGRIAESYAVEPIRKADMCLDFVVYGVGCFSRIVANGWRMDY